MNINIRQATPADVQGIFDVRTSVIENALTYDELEELGITKKSISDMIVNSLCSWVAVESNIIVGFSMIDIEAGALFAAFVLPSHEGQGIGRKLVEAAEQQLFEFHQVCWLETGKATRAAGFYRYLGWGSELDIGSDDIRLIKYRG